MRWNRLFFSVADPDPKDPNHFAGAGSGSEIFDSDPDPDPDPKHTLKVLVPELSKVVKKNFKDLLTNTYNYILFS